MDRYATFADYVAAKLSIADRAHIVVVNLDDPALATATPQATVRGFSLRGAAGACYGIERADGTLWLVANGERIINVDEIAAGGEHNRVNALAAIALTDTMAVSRSAQRTALMAFSGLPHRCQTVSVRNRVEWIDDSKGTNVGATCAAIAGVFAHRGGVLIAGGQGKGADFGPLADALTGRVHSVVLIGEDAAVIARAIESVVDVQFALDMRSAVATADSLARPGEAVLLSPACASFDMFDNFAARGKAFAAAVNEGAGA
jgi:UDP-N-acetylmuramoylalanine--D-glutamate ligase